ncbi:hypothetical protein E2C01_033894 [Portunus trituberculatus]|uniref:Uncharacterized protein n=1 Tax=Portunus trituberculatus TaxID=210409 RepID=A0A5B7F4X9_PORTR|nr:hypothetical protein [Portunus trituberculatus]
MPGLLRRLGGYRSTSSATVADEFFSGETDDLTPPRSASSSEERYMEIDCCHMDTDEEEQDVRATQTLGRVQVYLECDCG